jgi:carbamoyl-phosphate synthase small subunit
MVPALVVLADGTNFVGEALGHEGSTTGEAVFNTSMSGYQEILTDPSYRGQLVTMTMPHIGNYGVNPYDVESDRIQVAGLIVRQASRIASSWRATATLHDYLVSGKTTAITGVDTRALTRQIRDAGAQMGAIVHGATRADVPAIVDMIRAAPDYGSIDYVAAVSTRSKKKVRLVATPDPFCPWVVSLLDDGMPWTADEAELPEVAVIDFGVKYSILRYLALQGLRVTLWPHTTTADQILASGATSVMLSNGPGDPGIMDQAVATTKALIGKMPMFGICLGHQLIGRALGGTTFKLKFGHRGPNQPVMDDAEQRVQITSQNHGYAVQIEPGAEVQISHRNLNDGTCEGLLAKGLRVMSVQHHPEAGPGPHDAVVEFERFRAWITAVHT